MVDAGRGPPNIGTVQEGPVVCSTKSQANSFKGKEIHQGSDPERKQGSLKATLAVMRIHGKFAFSVRVLLENRNRPRGAVGWNQTLGPSGPNGGRIEVTCFLWLEQCTV